MNRKIAAYTILEVTVVMILSAICIGIIYHAFSITGNSLRLFEDKSRNINEYVFSDKQLRKDMAEAYAVRKTETGLQLQLDSGSVSYTFHTNYILIDRYSIRTDTLKVPVVSWEAEFETQPVAEGARVDKLVLQTVLRGEQLNNTYSKWYSAEDLFK